MIQETDNLIFQCNKRAFQGTKGYVPTMKYAQMGASMNLLGVLKITTTCGFLLRIGTGYKRDEAVEDGVKEF